MAIPAQMTDFTADWLNENCSFASPVTKVTAERIAVGEGFLGELARLSLEYEGEPGRPTVIAKIPTTDSGLKPLGVMLRAYEREHRFFDQVAPHVEVRLPGVLYNGFDLETDEYALVLEDLREMEDLDQVVGATRAQTEACLTAAAGFHARWWEHEWLDDDLSWVPPPDSELNMGLQALVEGSWDALHAKWGHLYPPEVMAQLEPYVPRMSEWLTEGGWARQTLVHNDFRLDNLFHDGEHVVIIDWQLLGRGDGMGDVVPFLIANTQAEVRAAHEVDLLRGYHDELRRLGGGHERFEDVWRVYRGNMLFWLAVWGNTASTVAPSERGDQLMETVLTRAIAAVAEHQPLDLTFDFDWRPGS